ncbi:transposase [Deinococcus oregonensis]|uniref:Transposase n=1 Tax=Deinococcus oregonensis TaxID=1805970 RepID=A0ABV6AST7_9DEIO
MDIRLHLRSNTWRHAPEILTLTDEFTRQSLAIRVAEAFTSTDVKAVLGEVIKDRGAPTFLCSDNGSEFIARDLGIWLAVQEVSTRNTLPGKPWQNGFAESFHSRLREECLSPEVFSSAQHASVLIEGWQAFYNAHRPHSSLAYQTPDEFAATWLTLGFTSCTLYLSRVSTRSRPNIGASPRRVD